MEEQEDGAQIVKVEHIALFSVSENVLFAKALDIRQLSAETEMIQDQHSRRTKQFHHKMFRVNHIKK